MTSTRIHVLTSCTASKVATGLPVAAERLYCGQHHVRLMRGVGYARASGIDVRLSIVSAGYGVIAGERPVESYEQTFQGKSVDARRQLARALGIPQAVRSVLRDPADLHMVLLGDDYLEACEMQVDLAPSAPVLVLCAAGTALRMPPIPDIQPIALSTGDTRRFRCGLVSLKGEIGGRLLAHIANENPATSEFSAANLLDTLAAMPPSVAAAATTLF